MSVGCGPGWNMASISLSLSWREGGRGREREREEREREERERERERGLRTMRDTFYLPHCIPNRLTHVRFSINVIEVM